MKYIITVVLFTILVKSHAQDANIHILIVGSDHLSQVYKEDVPNTDILMAKNQNEIEIFTGLLEKFNPDMIGIEDTRDLQSQTDSLYNLYKLNKLELNTLADGRSEKYQIAYRIGKNVGIDKISCINYKGGTSQDILDNGDNIEIYKNEGKELRDLVIKKYGDLYSGELSLKDYLIFLNQPETYKKVYHLRYVTPAKVRNGTFKNPDDMVDVDFVDNEYIGAELISIFKNRDYKIYSNIVKNQMEQNAQRIIVVIGVAHIESLKKIFSGDPDYKIIDANDYLLE